MLVYHLTFCIEGVVAGLQRCSICEGEAIGKGFAQVERLVNSNLAVVADEVKIAIEFNKCVSFNLDVVDVHKAIHNTVLVHHLTFCIEGVIAGLHFCAAGIGESLGEGFAQVESLVNSNLAVIADEVIIAVDLNEGVSVNSLSINKCIAFVDTARYHHTVFIEVIVTLVDQTHTDCKLTVRQNVNVAAVVSNKTLVLSKLTVFVVVKSAVLCHNAVTGILSQSSIKSDILSRHGFGRCPTREEIAGRCFVCGCDNSSAVYHFGGIIFLTVNCPCYGVGINLQCCIKRDVLCGDSFGYCPAGEGVTFGHFVFGCDNSSAVYHFSGIIFLAVNCPCYGVGLSGKSCIKSDVFRRHGGRNLPTGEDVAGNFCINRSVDLCAKFYFGGIIFLTVNCPCYGVGLSGESCIKGKILSRHGFGDILPCGEGVTFRLFVFGNFDRCAVIVGNRFAVSFAIDRPSYGIGLSCEGCIQRNVFRRHGFGNVPAGEGHAVCYGVTRSHNTCAVFKLVGRIGCVIDRPSYGVAVDLQCCIKGKILSRHGFGNILPCGEGVTGSYFVFGSGDLRTEFYFGGIIFLTIDLPSYGVAVDRLQRIQRDVLFGHNVGNSPTCEGVTFGSGIFGSNDLFANHNACGSKELTVHCPSYGVAVRSLFGQNSIKGDVLSRHGGRCCCPTRENVAFSYLVFGSNNLCAKGNGGFLIKFAIDLPCNGVFDCCQSCVKLKILGRHGGRNAEPCKEVVAMGYVKFRLFNCRTVSKRHNLAVEFAIDRPSNGVLVHGLNSIKLEFFGGHGFGNLPSFKGMTFGIFVFGSGDLVAVGNRCGSMVSAIDHPNNGIGLSCQSRIKGDVLSRHGSGNLPTREGVACGRFVFGSGERRAEFNRCRFAVNFAIDRPSYGVAVDLLGSIQGDVFRRHGFGKIGPTRESIPLFAIIGSGDLCTEFINCGITSFAVYDPCDGVLVRNQSGIQGNVFGGHLRGYFPTREGVTIGNGIRGNGDLVAVGNGCNITVLHTADHPSNGVGINRKSCIEGRIFCRHGSGNAGPTREGVTFGLFISGNFDRCAVIVGNRFAVNFAVDRPSYSILVHGYVSIECDVLSRHGFRHFPTREGITGLLLVTGSGNGCTIRNVSGSEEFAVNVPSNGVLVHSQSGIQRNVFRRHGNRHFPTREGMTFGSGICGSGNGCTIRKFVGGEEFTVNVPSNGVLVHSQSGIQRDVFTGHGFGKIGPTREGVTFERFVFGNNDNAANCHLGGIIFLTVNRPSDGKGLKC